MVSRPNPFSARSIRPGAIPFVFTDGQDAAGVVALLSGSAWRGQIVGPHGSGKSTLLAALAEPLAAVGRRTWTAALHDGQRNMPKGWLDEARRRGANMIIVDGYEQLSYFSRWFLRLRCRWQGWGLVVTAHRDVGLPTLLRTRATLDVAQAVVERLLPPGDDAIGRQLVAERFAAAGGNLRETLFALYDEYQRRQTSCDA